MKNKYFYIFDLDGTLTKQETLPLIAESFKISAIEELTKSAIKGEVPYIENFIKRINLLKQIEVSKINNLLEEIELFSALEEFINQNFQNCAIATTNLDVWIEKLTKNIKAKVYTSQAIVENDTIKKLTYILKKEDIVKEYQQKGYTVVFVGDGHNDLEAMRIADISIASGLIHYPANSLLSIVDYLIFNESRLIDFLQQIQGVKNDISMVLSVAGIGSRLGLNRTKVLLTFNNETLLKRHLTNFEDIKDVRLVVGYQANEVIEETLKHRRDVVFVYNHDYFYTKTGYSYYLGAKYANEYVIEWDGDLVVKQSDVQRLLIAQEYVAGSEIQSQEPVFLNVKEGSVESFSLDRGNYEWSGPCCLKRERIEENKGNVYSIIKPYLPLSFIKIDGMDIDTYEDYLKVKALYE